MSILDRISRMALGERSVSRAGRIVKGAPPVLGDAYLTPILDMMDNQPERKRLGTGEGEFGHYVHVSSLIGACVRQQALASVGVRELMESVTGGHRVMWAIGRHVEHHIRTQYLKATNYRNAFGHWSCVCKHAKHTGHHPTDARCERCGQGLDVYGEYTLYDHERWIKGNPDLLIMVNGWIIVVEIKSINAKAFAELKAPMGDHVFQAGMYQEMATGEGFQVHPETLIVYCTKEFKHGSPYREFHVDTRKPMVRNLMEDAQAMGAQLRRHREGGQLPPRQLCASHSTTRAKNCPLVASCFNSR